MGASRGRARALPFLLILALLHLRAGLPIEEQLSRRIAQLYEAGLHAAAAEHMVALSDAVPGDAQYAFNAGFLLKMLGDAAAAARLYERAVSAAAAAGPADRALLGDALNNLGDCHRHLGRSDLALQYFRRAYDAAPDLMPVAGTNACHSLVAGGDAPGGLACYAQLLRRHPGHAQAQFNYAVLLRRSGRVLDAGDAYGRAIRADGTFAAAYLNLATLHHQFGVLEESLPLYEGALRLLRGGPRQDDSLLVTTLTNLGVALEQLGRAAEAEARYAEALRAAEAELAALGVALRPAEAEPYALPPALAPGETDADAEAATEAAAAAAPQGILDAAVGVRAQMQRNRRHACRWEAWELRWQQLFALASRQQLGRAGGEPALLPFDVLGLPVPPLFRRRVAEAHAERYGAPKTVADGFPPLLGRRPQRPAERLRVGYLCHDLNDHPTMHLVEGLFVWHRRRRGDAVDVADVARGRAAYRRPSVADPRRLPREVLGGGGGGGGGGASVSFGAYSYGKDDGSPYRFAAENLANAFVNLVESDFEESVRVVRKDELHVAVDLQSHTLGGRTELMAARVAPVQVSYLVFPGTSGASFVDYAAVDSTVVPPEHAPHYTERLLYLPRCYQVNFYERHDQLLAQQARDASLPAEQRRAFAAAAAGREGAAAFAEDDVRALRARHGLPPPPAAVFANLNKLDKVEPQVFGVWMGVLQRSPGSVLWLLLPSRRAAADAVVGALRAEAASRGVHPARLIFAARVPKHEHLARLQLADLHLDTFLYGAHSTATDALRGALPTLTGAFGASFPERVGLDVLRAASTGAGASLPMDAALAAAGRRDFQDLAVFLVGAGAAVLGAAKAELRGAARRSELFDTAAFARDFEAALRVAFEIYQSAPLLGAARPTLHIVVGRTR